MMRTLGHLLNRYYEPITLGLAASGSLAGSAVAARSVHQDNMRWKKNDPAAVFAAAVGGGTCGFALGGLLGMWWPVVVGAAALSLPVSVCVINQQRK